MGALIKYSVIIPSYNSENTISSCLQSITRQSFEDPYEIIVVDSSKDATSEIIRDQFPHVQLIHLDSQTDPGAARNVGVTHAKGEILCFIDADCIADPDWLTRIVATHTIGYAAVGGAVVNGNPDSLIGWAGYFAEFREFFPFHGPELRQNIPTCNISYKREIFDRYGGFPDVMPDCIRHKHPQQEDLVLNRQLFTHGEKIFFDPDIQVAHINMTSLYRFFIHQYRLGRNTSYLLKRFRDLHGSFIARSGKLTVLIGPLLPCVKFFNTFRVATLSKGYLRKFVLSSPVLFAGLCVWGTGFINGAFIDD